MTLATNPRAEGSKVNAKLLITLKLNSFFTRIVYFNENVLFVRLNKTLTVTYINSTISSSKWNNLRFPNSSDLKYIMNMRVQKIIFIGSTLLRKTRISFFPRIPVLLTEKIYTFFNRPQTKHHISFQNITHRIQILAVCRMFIKLTILGFASSHESPVD